MQKVLDSKLNFLGLPAEQSSFETSRIAVLPVPYEQTVTYGRGTKLGPSAILKASHFVETFDEETNRDIAQEHGIATLVPMTFGKKRDAAAIQALHDIATGMLEKEKFPVFLGGEHSISAGTIAACAKRYPNLSVLQFDAHADLRPAYRGTKYSHASVMARVCEFLDPKKLIQVGIRALSREEAEYIRDNGVNTFYAHEIRKGKYTRVLKYWDDLVVEKLTDHVYITFDVDAFDPSTMPATGTPEPNGLLWSEVTQCLRKVSRQRKIVGFDIVELSPLKGFSFPDLTAAKLALKILNYSL